MHLYFAKSYSTWSRLVIIVELSLGIFLYFFCFYRSFSRESEFRTKFAPGRGVKHLKKKAYEIFLNFYFFLTFELIFLFFFLDFFNKVYLIFFSALPLAPGYSLFKKWKKYIYCSLPLNISLFCHPVKYENFSVAPNRESFFL